MAKTRSRRITSSTVTSSLVGVLGFVALGCDGSSKSSVDAAAEAGHGRLDALLSDDAIATPGDIIGTTDGVISQLDGKISTDAVGDGPAAPTDGAGIDALADKPVRTTSDGGGTDATRASGAEAGTGAGGTDGGVGTTGAGGTTSTAGATSGGGTATTGGATGGASTGGTTSTGGTSGTGGSGSCVGDASVDAGDTGCTDLLHDDFLGSIVNLCNWHIPTWVSSTDGTFYGQTQQRCNQNAPLPAATNSDAIIALNTYNPTGGSFYGTDLISNPSFTAGVRVAVRAKMNAMPEGVVGGIFLYAPAASASNQNHDEIDFELLTSDPANVHTNIYANKPLGYGNPTSHSYGSGSITDYHTYEIQWLPDQVSWSVDGAIVRTVTADGGDASVDAVDTGGSSGQSPVPAGPMYLHLNIWVPASDFTAAYDPSLHWTTSAADDRTYSMSVDWVEVTPIKCRGGGASVDAGDTVGL